MKKERKKRSLVVEIVSKQIWFYVNDVFKHVYHKIINQLCS